MCQLTPEQREAYEDFLGSDLVHKVLTTYWLLTTHQLLVRPTYHSSDPASSTRC